MQQSPVSSKPGGLAGFRCAWHADSQEGTQSSPNRSALGRAQARLARRVPGAEAVPSLPKVVLLVDDGALQLARDAGVAQRADERRARDRRRLRVLAASQACSWSAGSCNTRVDSSHMPRAGRLLAVDPSYAR